MEFDFFLWPMVLPLFILMLYAFSKKHELFRLSISILFVGCCIVIIYWPLLTLELFNEYNYIVVKFLVFVFLPIIIIAVGTKLPIKQILINCGIRKKGWRVSLAYFLLLLPIMFITSLFIIFFSGVPQQVAFGTAILYFFEAFSEEFFFRGILFLLLLVYVDVRIAYVISLISFILIHPQHLTTLFLLSTGVQGVLTLEIVRRSNNLFGAWLLHGVNRVFLLLIIPFILG